MRIQLGPKKKKKIMLHNKENSMNTCDCDYHKLDESKSSSQTDGKANSITTRTITGSTHQTESHLFGHICVPESQALGEWRQYKEPRERYKQIGR